MKNRTEALVGKLMANKISVKLQTHLTVDFIIKLSLVAGKDAILVVCNRLLKIAYFVATMEGTSVKGLTRLFRNNMWKLHGLPESVIGDRGPQFVAELTKELNRMLGIETRLLKAFYLQTDGQMEQINKQLEQYLRFFIEYRQRNQPEQLATEEFAVNNKIYSATKVLPFIANYGKELRMGGDIRRKGKATELIERMKKVQEEAGATLRKAQEEMKW